MKFWQAVSFLEAEQLLEVATTAEKVGFDGAFVSDHVFFPVPLVSKSVTAPQVPHLPLEPFWNTLLENTM